MDNLLLDVKDVKKYFPVYGGLLNRVVNHVKAVDGVSFSIRRGETFGLVGESGCGKSTTGRAVLQLLRPTGGEVIYKGENLVGMEKEGLRQRRREMQMVFQDPYSSLNPRLKVYDILAEPLKAHQLGTQESRKEMIATILTKVGLTEAHMYRYPHEFSGGQRQRIGIARAIILNPELLVLDEPVSALDVSIQSQILNLLQDLQEEFGLTYLFISHALNVVAHICDRVGVMYLGSLVEVGPVEALYENPLHPYTQSLLAAIPEPDPENRTEEILLQGDVPSPQDIIQGCAFRARCLQARPVCAVEKPELAWHSSGVQVACHLYR